MRFLAVLVLAMLLFGCGSENLRGSYLGNVRFTSGQSGGQAPEEQVRMDLTHTGNQITGTWTNPYSGANGTVSGSVDGNRIPMFSISFTQGGRSQCAGVVTGSATYDKGWFNAQVTGTTSCGTLSSSFQLARTSR